MTSRRIHVVLELTERQAYALVPDSNAGFAAYNQALNVVGQAVAEALALARPKPSRGDAKP